VLNYSVHDSYESDEDEYELRGLLVYILQNDDTIATDLTLLNFEIVYREYNENEEMKYYDEEDNYEPTSDDTVEIYGLVYARTESELTLTIVEC